MSTDPVEERLRRYGAVLEEAMARESTVATRPRRRNLVVSMAALVLAAVACGVAVRAVTGNEGVVAVGPDPSPDEGSPAPSTGQPVDTSRLVSDRVPAGLELALAAENARLGPPLNTTYQAAYGDEAGRTVVWVEWSEPGEVSVPDPLDESVVGIVEEQPPTFPDATVVVVDGVEVAVYGAEVRRASFVVENVWFHVNGPWEPGEVLVSDDDLVAVASAVIAGEPAMTPPGEVLDLTLIGVDEVVDYAAAGLSLAGSLGVKGAPTGSTTVYAERATPPAGPGPPDEGRSIEIRVRPTATDVVIPFEARAAANSEWVDLGGVMALTRRVDWGYLYDDDNRLVRVDTTDREVRYLALRLGGHEVAIHTIGLNRTDLLDVASNLREATGEEWGTGLG